jgi:hypothetical protein
MSEECALGCGKPVNPFDAGVWKEVRGFVGGPKKDSMRVRQDTGRYAHDSCVAAHQAGQAVDQPSLLDNDVSPVIPRDGGISGAPIQSEEGWLLDEDSHL